MRTTLLALGLVAGLEAVAAAQADDPARAVDPARADARECQNAPVALPPDQHVLLCAALTGPMEPQLRLARIEAALERIKGPSTENAMLTGARVQALLALKREEEALREVRVAMQRYPRLPPLWMQATSAFTYTEYTAEAADFWVALAGFNPDAARRVPGYHWRVIRERLSTQGKPDKVLALARALEAIRYDGGSEASRSGLAEELFDAAVATGDWARAEELLPRISDPAKRGQISVDARTERLWDDVNWTDQQARAAVLRRWIEGLGEAARNDPDQGGRFIAAAVAYSDPGPVLAAYEPVLRAAMQDGAARTGDFGFAYWLAPLANAHAIAGDDAGAEALYRDALAFFSTLDNPVRLNVSANLALFLQARGRNEEALALIDSSIAELQRVGGLDGALLQMHGVRVRALAGLGREPEAWRSLELLRQNRATAPEVYLQALLGLGRYDEARDLLIELLRGQDGAMRAVAFLQPPAAPFRPPHDVAPDDAMARLRNDPLVLEALQGRGRILALEPVRIEPLELPELSPDPPPLLQ